MGVCIREVMSGWYSLGESQRPLRFNISAYTPYYLRFNRLRKFTGFIDSPGYFREATTEGTLRITGYSVEYDFNFEDPEYGKLRVIGAKQYRLKNLIQTLITLPIELFNEKNQKVGDGELVYREPLWKFPLGVSLCSETKAFRPHKKWGNRLVQLADVLIPNFREDVITESELKQKLEYRLDRTPQWIRISLFASYCIIQLIAFFKFVKKISELNSSQNKELCDFLMSSPLINLSSTVLNFILFSSVYSSGHYLKKHGVHEVVPPASLEYERYMENCQRPERRLGLEQMEVDVLVVGSGAGGAPLAYRLAERGMAVAIIEEGEYLKRNDFLGKVETTVPLAYRNFGMTGPISKIPIWLPTGKSVGGTTTINSGTCYRTPDEVMEKWKRDLGLNGINSDSMDPYFSEVEEMLDVKATDKNLLGPIGEIVDEAFEGTDFTPHALHRDETGCDGQSYCVLGCPTDAKRSTNVSYIPEALKKNAFLFSNYKVRKILRQGNRITGIEAFVEGFGEEFKLVIRAKKVVISAGSLNTPTLLAKSGIANHLSHLGKHLTIHPAITVGAIFDKIVQQKNYVPQSYAVDGFDDFILEGYTLSPDSLAFAFPLFGEQLTSVMNQRKKFTNFAAMTFDVLEGRVCTKTGLVFYPSSKPFLDLLKQALIVQTEMFLRAGAKKVYLPLIGQAVISNQQELDELKSREIHANQLRLSAHHPLGTCRMAADPERGVVDQKGRVFGYKNLYISDASILHGPLKRNPQITIMSHALRIADGILEELQS